MFLPEEAASVIFSTGYRKPLSKLTLGDKGSLRSVILTHHCMLTSKAAMDQFCEGLEVLDVLGMMRLNSDIMMPLFIDEEKPLTAGLS